MPTVLAFMFSALLLTIVPDNPVMAGDSSTYLNFAPFRTAGYPLFLDLFGIATPFAQIAIFGVSSALLGEAVAYRSKPWVGALVVVGMFINPEIAPLHWSILTDSLAISLGAVFLACCLTERWVWATVMAGLAAAVRPSCYPMIAVLLVLVLPHWRVMIAVSLIWLGIVGMERAYSYSVHGSELTSLVPRHLAAKAALTGNDPRYASVRQLLKDAEGKPFRLALQQDYEVCLQWACKSQAQSIDPDAYLKLSWDEYRGLWEFGSRTHPAFAPQYDAFVRSHQMPFAAQIAKGGALEPTTPRRMAYVARPLFIALGFLMAFALLWAWRDRRLLAPALFVQSTLIFTALTAVGYGRYTMLVWPGIVCCLAFLCSYAADRLPRSRRAASDARPTQGAGGAGGAVPNELPPGVRA